MVSYREQWDWVEEQWWASRRAVALAEIRLYQMENREAAAKAVLKSATELFVSSRIVGRAALGTGNVERFTRAEAGMRRAAGRYRQAQGELSALRPALRVAAEEKSRLQEDAQRWERMFGCFTTHWLIGAWARDWRDLMPVECLVAWYCVFAENVREALEEELDIFVKAVHRLIIAC